MVINKGKLIQAAAKVFVADSKNLEAVREFSVQELLPSAFIIVS